ncbi:unnamed protein product [Allacma fusca]|uniref:Uncharacterized protein n=1 Tax=Allacma fusca TaxID=39272 RepID=A0A8J2JI76_9HEXA|nr:unnamed protein product [Allacma fusca]
MKNCNITVSPGQHIRDDASKRAVFLVVCVKGKPGQRQYLNYKGLYYHSIQSTQNATFSALISSISETC